MPIKLLAVLFTFVALASACGDSEDTSVAADPTITTASDELPVDSGEPDGDAAVSGPAAGTCLAGDDDCQDTGGDMAAPPPPVDGADDDSPETVIVAVEGIFHSGPDGTFLCGLLLESLPPQCGDQIAEVVGLDINRIDEFIDPDDGGLLTEQGISWTDSFVTLFGELVDGQLNVDVG